MKRLIICCLLISLLLACVPTPEEEFVVNKADQQQMLENANRKDEKNEITDLNERLGAPKTYQASLSVTEGRLQVEVDAKVLLPEGELPIVRVEPAGFTKSDALAFADVLLPQGSEFVEPVWVDDPRDYGDEEEHRLYLYSKGFYAHEIEKMRWAIEHWDDGGSFLYDMDESTPADVENRVNEQMYEMSLAPDKLPRVDRGSVDIGWMIATVDDLTFSDVSCISNPWDGLTEMLVYRRDFIHNPNVDCKQKIPNEIPYRDAEAQAQALIEKLPVEGFILNAAWPETYDDDYYRQIPCWRFVFTRSFNSVPETATNAEQTFENYNHSRGYEKIMVTVDADGIAGMRYNYPYKVMDTVVEKTNLMSFSEIEKIFNRMILVYKNHLMDESFEHISTKYVITTIRLGLVNIPEKDSEAGLLVPAWDFMGYRHSFDEDTDYSTNELESFLTINAVDGSIINRAG